MWRRKANEIQRSRVLQACSLPPWPPSRPHRTGPSKMLPGGEMQTETEAPAAASPWFRTATLPGSGARGALGQATWCAGPHEAPQIPGSQAIPPRPPAPGKPTLCAPTTMSSGDAGGTSRRAREDLGLRPSPPLKPRPASPRQLQVSLCPLQTRSGRSPARSGGE